MQLGVFKALSTRQRLSVLLALVVCLAGFQVWLTVRLMEQDRNLEIQRSRERLTQIADLAVGQLGNTLGDWDLGLHELYSLPPSPTMLTRLPAGATFVLMSQSTITVYPHKPLLDRKSVV